MLKFLLTVAIFLSSALFAQEHKVLTQDKGMTIEHSTCRLWVGSIENRLFHFKLSDEEKDVIKRKGYKIIGSFDPFNQMSTQKSDLIFAVDYKSYDSNWEYSFKGDFFYAEKENQEIKNLKKIVALKGFSAKKFRKKLYFTGAQYNVDRILYSQKGINNRLELFEKIPECSATSTGLTTERAQYDFSIRDYELSACIDNYGKEIRNIEKPTQKGKRLINIGGIWMMTGGVLVPPLYIAGAGVLIYNNFNFIKSISNSFILKKLRDGKILMRAVLKCEQAKDRGENCTSEEFFLENNLSKKGYRLVRKFIDRMGFEDFSERFTNSIVQKKTCSNPEIVNRKKRYHKLLKEAKKNF